jgi:Spy/CpxP family protein refolding chaperone
MKRSHKIVTGLAASVSLAAAALVYAQPAGSGPCMGAGMGPHGMGGKMGAGNPAAMVESHLTSLKSELNITPGQEGAWQAFAAKAKQQAESMQAIRAGMQQAPGSAPERMSQHTEIMKQRLAGMEAMTSAVKDLYAALTPEQKAIADKHFQMMGGRHMAFNAPVK